MAASSAAPPPGLGLHPQEMGGAPDSSDDEFKQAILGKVEAHVSLLLGQARVETEGKVKVELKQIIDTVQGMDRRLDQMIAQIDAIEPKEAAPANVSSDVVGQLLSKVEQQWGQEIKTLKEELHQTILAHNHNADLIKHHKETLDALEARSLEIPGSQVKSAEIQQQLQRLDQRLKQQQKQRTMEPLFERLQILESCVARAVQSRAAAYRMGGFPGMPPMAGLSAMMPPGMLGPPGM